MTLKHFGEFGRFSLMAAVIALFFCLHISIGAKQIPLSDVFSALIARDDTIFDHIVVWNLRMPRALIAMVVGAALAVSGALMQGITRNPLADPGLLGLLAGASFAVVVGFAIWGSAIAPIMPLVAAGGALVASALVLWIASSAPGGARPLTLILSGAAITAFLWAIIAAVQLLDQDNFDQLRVWLTGTISSNRMEYVAWCLPWFVAGFLVSLAVARQITSLAMGEEVAIGLGVNVAQVKILSLFAVVALTASAVTLAGPLGFIGLIIPHAVRLFVGTDFRFVVPYSALAGAAYLLFVDIVARIVLAPVEISTGLITSLLGAPFFVWLVKAKL